MQHDRISQTSTNRKNLERSKMNTSAKNCFLTYLASCLLALFIGNNAVADRLPPAQQLLPPETIIVMEIPDFNQLKLQWEKTNAFKLYKEPAMDDFFGKIRQKYHEEVQKTENKFVRAVLDAGTLPKKRMVLALVQNQKAINIHEPVAVCIIQWGKNVKEIKPAVRETTDKAVDEGAYVKSDEYRGIKIISVIAEQKNQKQDKYSESDRIGYGISKSISYCFIEDTLVASEDIELLKFVIAQIKGASTATLASDSDYKDSINSLGPHHDINIYCNIKKIMKTRLRKDTTAKFTNTMQKLGFDNLSSFALTAAVAGNKANTTSAKALLKIDGAKKGICKMLEPQHARIKAPDFIPQSATSAYFYNLDIKLAYSQLLAILNDFGPQYASPLYVPIIPQGPHGQPPIRLKPDIIDYLGSQILMAQLITKPHTLTSVNHIFAVSITNKTPLEKSLARIHQQYFAHKNPDAKRELLGYNIYTVNLAGLIPFLHTPEQRTPMQQQSRSQKMPKFAFSLTDTHLIFGQENPVEKAIRTLVSDSAHNLSSKQWFNSAKPELPSVVGFASLTNNASSVEHTWWMLKESQKQQNTLAKNKNQHHFFPFAQAEFIDCSLLPEFEKVKKYFTTTTCFALSRPEGFYFEFKQLK